MQGSVCAPWSIRRTNIFMSSISTSKTSCKYLGSHIQWNDTFLEYWDSFGRRNVTDRDMRFHMKIAAYKIGYPSRNILLDRIDTHSNRAGGACAMKLAGFYDESIRKMVRWLPPSNAFLVCIQQHPSELSQGVATKIIRISIFAYMEGSENHTE